MHTPSAPTFADSGNLTGEILSFTFLPRKGKVGSKSPAVLVLVQLLDGRMVMGTIGEMAEGEVKIGARVRMLVDNESANGAIRFELICEARTGPERESRRIPPQSRHANDHAFPKL